MPSGDKLWSILFERADGKPYDPTDHGIGADKSDKFRELVAGLPRYLAAALLQDVVVGFAIMKKLLGWRRKDDGRPHHDIEDEATNLALARQAYEASGFIALGT
jgi:hypothetical protein